MPSSSNESIVFQGTSHEPGWKLFPALAIWSGLTVIALVLLIRRLSGALTAPASGPAVCLVALSAMGLSVLAHFSFHSSVSRRLRRRWQVAAAGVTLLPPIALALALLPISSPAVVWFLGLLLLLASLPVIQPISHRWKWPTWWKTPQPASTESEFESPLGDIPLTSPAADPFSHEEEDRGFFSDVDSRNLSQWMMRAFTAEGGERITGAVRIHFVPAQRQATIHLAFSPPLNGQPEFSCEPAEESPVRLKVATVRPYGVRIEFKRSGPIDLAKTVEVTFSAITTAAAAYSV